MAIKPTDEERSFGADREQQREISTESARSARPSNGENVTRDDAPDSGSSARGRSNRGFASMDRTKQREIASKGGRAAHEKGTAHEFDAGEARAAGRKGGVTVSRNREHMAAIGRRGGEARGANRAARLQSQNNESATTNGSSQAAQNASSRFQGDREVGLEGSGSRPSAPTAPRPSGNSLGGESRNAASYDDRNVERT
ncbi:hypothetical protein BH09GEM1_BH09GEM1_43830 [soil metagenome]